MRDARIEAGPREGMVIVPDKFEALRAEVAKLARKVDQLAEVDAIMRGVDAPDGPRSCGAPGTPLPSLAGSQVASGGVVVPARRAI